VDNNNNIILIGSIITPFKLIKDQAVFIGKGKIIGIKDGKDIEKKANSEIIEVKDGFIVPGFIDVHIHGGGGFDVMDGNYEAIKQVAKTHSKYGTTSFLPTTMTMNKNKIIKSLKSIKEAYAKGTRAAEVLGVNLEGPFINPLKKGAQKEEYIRNASVEEFMELNQAAGNLIRIVTIAPEMPEAKKLIRWLYKHNIIASVGHSNATYKQVQEGIAIGLNHVTHIFNAMTGFSQREPGIVGAALFSPELIVEMIADGIHLHPLAMKLVTKVKEMDKIILITDSIRAAGKPDGIYNLGDQEVIVADGEARLKDGTLAGSVLTLDKAVRNMVNIVGLSFIEAIRMVTINPAKCLGIEDKKGSLELGKDADIVILNKKLEVNATLVKGKIIYKRERE
jgi:N-acetylglucosamine-6-phosphate deacetylase